MPHNKRVVPQMITQINYMWANLDRLLTFIFSKTPWAQEGMKFKSGFLPEEIAHRGLSFDIVLNNLCGLFGGWCSGDTNVSCFYAVCLQRPPRDSVPGDQRFYIWRLDIDVGVDRCKDIFAEAFKIFFTLIAEIYSKIFLSFNDQYQTRISFIDLKDENGSPQFSHGVCFHRLPCSGNSSTWQIVQSCRGHIVQQEETIILSEEEEGKLRAKMASGAFNMSMQNIHTMFGGRHSSIVKKIKEQVPSRLDLSDWMKSIGLEILDHYMACDPFRRPNNALHYFHVIECLMQSLQEEVLSGNPADREPILQRMQNSSFTEADQWSFFDLELIRHCSNDIEVSLLELLDDFLKINKNEIDPIFSFQQIFENLVDIRKSFAHILFETPADNKDPHSDQQTCRDQPASPGLSKNCT